MTVGERIRHWRKRRGYGQAELARLVGIMPNTLWRIENEDREPRGPSLRKIAEILRVDVVTLRGLDEQADSNPDDVTTQAMARSSLPDSGESGLVR